MAGWHKRVARYFICCFNNLLVLLINYELYLILVTLPIWFVSGYLNYCYVNVVISLATLLLNQNWFFEAMCNLYQGLVKALKIMALNVKTEFFYTVFLPKIFFNAIAFWTFFLKPYQKKKPWSHKSAIWNFYLH